MVLNRLWILVWMRRSFRLQFLSEDRRFIETDMLQFRQYVLCNSKKKKITCSIYDSTNSWRDNVFSRNDVSKEENDKIK
jgi:hypothetical protein